RPIGTKWVLKNKKDKMGIVIRNKARLVAQVYTQKERIDYEEVFAPVAKIEAIRLFLAYASIMGFIVYQMDVKSAFLYGTIDEEVYVMQPPGFQDSEFPERVYKVEKAMYELHQAPRAWSANTPMDKENPWGKDGPGKDVELHLYRSMIGSLMYLTASRPDIMFAVCACARHQVTPKECHLHTVKRIFRYLKGHPKLGLWYPKESPFDLLHIQTVIMVTIVATFTTKAEYVAAASGCGQVLWIQNQMLDYGTVPLFASMIVTQGESSANPTEPHHTPSPQEYQSPQSDHSPQHDSPHLSHQTIIPEPISHDLQAPTVTLTPRRLTKRAIRIAHLDAGQDRENIAKTSAMPHESSPRVPSLDADEGSMQQRLHELMELCTSLQRQQSQMANKIKDQDLEISGLKARVKSLEDKERRREEPIQEDAPITGGIIDIKEELRADKSTEKGSTDTEEMVNVLSSMKAVIFCQVEEQIDAQVAKEMEEEFARENQRLSEQVARDSEIARIHAEEELKMMIEGLDRSNEVISKHLSEYKQTETELFVGEKIELIKQIKEKFIPVWKQFEDFVPMSSKEESERVKRSRIKLDQGSLKRKKISRTSRSEPSQEQQFKGSEDWEIHTEGKREYWKIIRLGGHTEAYQFFVDMLKHFDREDLHQLWSLVKETFSIKQSTSDKEKELWVELKRLFEPDSKDQLWTYHQAFMHDHLDWKLYDTCGVHHVSTKNQEIFMLVPSCYVIFDFEHLSLSFDFVFESEIFKSLSFSLDRLCHLAILCLDQHAHTLNHLESLLTISLDRLDIL
nr:copia protein [Tanacetum cinerariifolium]